MYKLREYQQVSVDRGVETIRNNKSAVLVEPTGSGKSIIIANIVKKLNIKTIVLQPSKEILEQNFQKMKDYGYKNIAIYSASLKSKEIGKITFATIGSVYKKPQIFEDVKLIIIDEAHTVNSDSGMYRDFIKHLKIPVLGLTATPYRMHAGYKFDKKSKMMMDELVVQAKFITRTKPKIFNSIANVTQICDLFEKGYLHKPVYYEDKNYNPDKIKLNSTGMDFDELELKRYNNKEDIVKKIFNKITQIDGKHILVFNKFVSEAEELNIMLKKVGVKSATVSSKTETKEREKIISDFKKGYIDVVTNVGVLTTGFDFPELDTIIIARPTRSLPLYYQMIGRVIRIHKNKKKAQVIDLCGNVKIFGKVETFEIKDTKKPRLKSDKGYLTGINIVTGEDMEGVVVSEGGYKSNNNIIPFGKHKGKHITKLDNGYLEWCAKNFTGLWKCKMQEELRRREKTK